MPSKTLIIVVAFLAVGAAAFFMIYGRQAPPETGTGIEGLEVSDLVVGAGAEAAAGDVIAVHYTGVLSDGTKFDSSYDRGQPFVFQLGAGQVIRGWDLGVGGGMRVGGKRKLVIAPELGYGERGAGNVIPSNATLIFEVELLAIQGK